VPQKRRLDFPGLHAIPANLDLVIRTAEKLDQSILAPPRKIPRLVKPPLRIA
jgi:hypothetical protein